MISENIAYMRRARGLSQEALAEKVGVTRQTVSKWETGESLPDLEKAALLAEALEVSLDELVSFEQEESSLPMPPKGRHMFGMVTVGDKGQIVIPVKARKIFDINPGDGLMVLGNEGEGLALMSEKRFMEFAREVLKTGKEETK